MIEIRPATSMNEGAGARVKRLMPVAGFRNFDPFVLWDDFSIAPGSGFPDHPHRGFEAITYLFQGSLRHEDNLGNASTVEPGGAQRFTAGRGLVHSEMPNREGTTRGIQLWINLPKRLKQIDPAYQQVDSPQFPETPIDGGTVKHLVGEDSPLTLLTEVIYQDIELTAGHSHSIQIPEGLRGLVYMTSGSVKLNDQPLTESDAAFIDDEISLDVTAENDARFMLCFGRPHGEPIIQYGPYVD